MADSTDDYLFDILAEVEPAATTKSDGVNFRIEINCQKGNHYMRTRRGSGTKRRKEFGTEEAENYHYDGLADLVVRERAGYYATRYGEWQSNHDCHYQRKGKEDQETSMGYPGLEDGA